MTDPRQNCPTPVAGPDEDPNVETVDAASPPCFMHEVDPAYAGYLDPPALRDLLNELLAGARAGAALAREMCGGESDAGARALLAAIAADEDRCCAMLSREIGRLGGAPTGRTGAFGDNTLCRTSAQERWALLDRGQGRAVRRLREALPRIADDRLHQALRDMLQAHERNLAEGERLLR